MHSKVYIILPSEIYYNGVSCIAQYVNSLMNGEQFIEHLEFSASYDGYEFGGYHDLLMKKYDIKYNSYEYYYDKHPSERILDNCARIDKFLEFFKVNYEIPCVRDLIDLDQFACEYTHEEFIEKLEAVSQNYIAYIDYHC
jgi:hypothetical protein